MKEPYIHLQPYFKVIWICKVYNKARVGPIKFESAFTIGVSGKITLHLKFVSGKPR